MIDFIKQLDRIEDQSRREDKRSDLLRDLEKKQSVRYELESISRITSGMDKASADAVLARFVADAKQAADKAQALLDQFNAIHP